MPIHFTIDSFLLVFTAILTALSAIFASSGFWFFIANKNIKKDLGTQLLLGLAHDRILSLSMRFIQRGSITQDEYENLFKFLYSPYIELGGNGTAKRLMEVISTLPITILPTPKTLETDKK